MSESATTRVSKASANATPHQRPLRLAIFANEKTVLPYKVGSAEWHDVAELLKARYYRSHKSGPMLGGYALCGSRSNQNVLHRSIIQLDIDSEVERDKGTGRLIAVTRQAPPLSDLALALQHCEWIATSSHSHVPADGVVKYRLTVLPDRDILPDEHELVLEALDEQLSGCLDRNAWPLSQAFFLPSCPAENAEDAFFIRNEAAPLSVDDFVARGRQIMALRQQLPAQPAPSAGRRHPEPDTPRRRARLQDALSFISADVDRNQWRDIIWAILSTGWPDAPAIAETWSKTAPHRFRQDSFEAIVAGYVPLHIEGLTLGTVYHFARRGGWNG